jgi:hypothetical protein
MGWMVAATLARVAVLMKVRRVVVIVILNFKTVH